MRRELALVCAIVCCLSLIASCSSDVNQEIVGTEQSSSVVSDKADSTVSSQSETVPIVSKYPRVGLSGYSSEYSKSVQTVSGTEYKTMDFSRCEFGNVPETTDVGIYKVKDLDITPEESLATIEAWLSSEHIENVDLKTELRDVSSQYPRNENMDPPYFYTAVFDHYPDFETGNGFLINTPDCHIQMGGYNIYSMSNGVITRYVNSGKRAIYDIVGDYSQTVIEQGNVVDLKDKSYQLLNGEVKIGDAADTVKKYFEKGTPLTGPEGMTIDVPYVSVFSIGDIYGYTFSVRRVYKGVPFIYGDFGTFQAPEDYQIDWDIKKAYTIDGNVDAYVGFTQGFEFEDIAGPQTQIISLETATDILEEFLAKQMKIEVYDVSFMYVTIEEVSTMNRTVYPCWVYTGHNNSDGRNIRCAVDSINGEVFYYTYLDQ
ncbi:MAG: hypothetical protein IJK65_12730 [Clostridiales bacterium]|nr:hypothetical protein [Clostridiales bacterium]